MSQFEPLTDQQWNQLEPLFPKVVKRGRGKPHASWRIVVNSVLLVLLSGVKWSSIPVTAEFATKSVSHRWFSVWDKSGFLDKLVEAYKACASQTAQVIRPPRRKRVPKPTVSLEIAQEDESPEEDFYEENLVGLSTPALTPAIV